MTSLLWATLSLSNINVRFGLGKGPATPIARHERAVALRGLAQCWPSKSEMRRMKSYLCILASFLALSGCSHAELANNSGSPVGITGTVSAQHESLGNSKHMLIVTASPALAETEGSIEQRIFIHAQREAARICPGRFEFVHNPNGTAPLAAGFMKRSRSYVFACG